MGRKLLIIGLTYIFASIPLLANGVSEPLTILMYGTAPNFWANNLSEFCFFCLSLILLSFVDFLDAVLLESRREFGFLDGICGVLLVVFFFLLILIYPELPSYRALLMSNLSIAAQLSYWALLLGASVTLLALSFQLRIGYLCLVED